MKRKIKDMAFLTIFMVVLYSHAQNGSKVEAINSKIQKYDAEKKARGIKSVVMDDTIKVNLLLRLTKLYWLNNPEKSAILAKQAVEISKALNYKDGIASGYYTGGISHWC